MNYIYSGTLIGVNDCELKLTNAKVVYETGELDADAWSDAQPIPRDLFVRLSAVESYSESTHD